MSRLAMHSKVLTIAGTTETGTRVDIATRDLDGYFWVQVETITATTGMGAVDLEIAPATKNRAGTWAEGAGGQVEIAANMDLQTVGDIMIYDINSVFSTSGAKDKFVGAEAFYVYLTSGGGADAGTIEVKVFMR